MFSLLRVALVIGAIFYFSPLRQGADSALSLDNLLGAAKQPLDAFHPPAEVTPRRLESMWNALPESARHAVIGKLLPSTPGTVEARRSVQTDTLQPEDHRPAWIGATKKPGA